MDPLVRRKCRFQGHSCFFKVGICETHESSMQLHEEAFPFPEKIMKMTLSMILFLFLSSPWLVASEVHDAVRDKDKAALSALLKRDPGLVNARDERNATPLHFACDRGHGDIAVLLIDAGADLSLRDVDGDTPLYWAAYAGHGEVVDMLMERGGSADDMNSNQLSPLHYAAMRGHEAVVESLLRQGAKIHAADYEGNTPLHLAAMQNLPRMVRLLVENGADLECKDNYGRTPLLLVARETGSAQMAQVLLDQGADLDVKDKYGDSSLFLAAWRGFKDLVDLVLDRGAAFDATGERGNGLLGCACNRGLDRLFAELMEKGADLKAQSAQGGSLLHSAATGGSAKIVKMLIDQGLKIDAPDRYGWRPLHCAAKRGRLEVVDLLISEGADLDAKSLAGRTAYSLAERWEHLDVTERLEEKGAAAGALEFPKLTGEYLGQKKPGKAPEVFALDIVSTDDGEHGCISFAPKGREAYWSSSFMVNDSGYSRGAILSTQWEKGGWTPPGFAFFCKGIGFGDDVPFCAPDGKRIYFISRRSIQPGGPPTKENIWFVEREGNRWSEPRQVCDAVNRYDVHWQLSVSSKGTLYIGCGQLGICASPLKNGKHTQPAPVKNKAGDDFSGGSPFIAPDESYLIFCSRREKGYGGEDLYIAFRDNKGEWGCPVNMGPDLNSRFSEQCPMVTPDGKYLFFISQRNGRNNIFWVEAGRIEELRTGAAH
ncbi:MAG: ankyrin repeat domain-containing protein [Planctomycetota bacterium]